MPEPPPDGTVAFLFSDVEGSTQLLERHGAAMGAALERHHLLLERSVRAHGGVVFETVGDAVYAAFARPEAAAAAALDAHRALGAEDWTPIVRLAVRIALHTGPVERRGNHYFGPVLFRAARLQMLGYGEQTLVSGDMARLLVDCLPPGATLHDLGTHQLKDLAEPEHIFQLSHADLRSDFPPLKTLVRAAEERKRRRRIRVLVGAVVGALATAAVLAYAFFTSPGAQPTVALFGGHTGVVGSVVEEGFDEGVGDFGLASLKVEPTAVGRESATDELRALSALEPALIVVFAPVDLARVAPDYSDVRYVVFDDPFDAPNVSSVHFRVWEGAYLAGAAAAMKSETGVVGFIGGADGHVAWAFQAGYEAGAKSVHPAITVLTSYQTDDPEDFRGYVDAGRARATARELFRQGADVIMNVAGDAGLGIMEAAEALSDELGRHLWVIGVDSDQYESVVRLPGATNAQAWREHILTSVVKRWDLVVYDALEEVASSGWTTEPRIVGLASGGVDIAYSGGFIEPLRRHLEELRAAIVAGTLRVPCTPRDRLEQAEALASQLGTTTAHWEEAMGCASAEAPAR
jgi:basic membrane lipoprotein Med (substrate-binding protein (PBP1-ABC) superfamily)/class 3 adenylate cyclase